MIPTPHVASLRLRPMPWAWLAAALLFAVAAAGCIGDGGTNDPVTPDFTEEDNGAQQEEETEAEEGEDGGPPEGEHRSFTVRTTGNYPYLLSSPGYDTDRLEVAWGDTITVGLKNEDNYHHDWSLGGFSDVTTGTVQAGGEGSVTFDAPEPGEYTFYCSVEDHRNRGQTGTLIVEEAD